MLRLFIMLLMFTSCSLSSQLSKMYTTHCWMLESYGLKNEGECDVEHKDIFKSAAYTNSILVTSYEFQDFSRLIVEIEKLKADNKINHDPLYSCFEYTSDEKVTNFLEVSPFHIKMYRIIQHYDSLSFDSKSKYHSERSLASQELKRSAHKELSIESRRCFKGSGRSLMFVVSERLIE